jgi:signal transduction histidine kinase
VDRRGSRRHLAAGLLALGAGAAALLACAREAPLADARPLEQAWFHPRVGEPPPARDDPEWRLVALPDFWGLSRRARALDGWYRLAFRADAGGQPWAVSIAGDWSALEVGLNGTPLLEALPRHADLVPPDPPLLVLLPPPPLPAENELLLRFRTVPWRIGFLGPVAVGPAGAVRAARDRQHLRDSVLPTSFAWFTLACAAILALLGRWEATGAGRWFAAGTAAWCLPLVEPLRGLAGSGEGFATSVLLHAFPPLFAIGFHRILQLRRPRLERALLATIAAGAGLRLLGPPLLVPAVDWLWWMVDLAIAAYLLPLMLRARRTGAIPRAGALLVAGAVGIAAGLHDVASLFAGKALLGVAWSPYAPAVLGLTTAAVLIATLGERLALAQRLNLELEQRVEEKRSELAESYARMAELERDRAITAERARLMRDMHDGAGGQVVSALAMVEGEAFEPSAVAEVLRDALTDLRFSIDSLDPSEPDLLALLGAARARLEPRLEARGLRFAWDVRDVPPPARFGPGTALQVLRIFQEAVVNALRHAQAQVIAVRTGEERDASGRWAFVEIADDGKGLDATAEREAARAGGGRGLGNMRGRAAAIGATLVIASGPDGTRVRLRLPCES